MLYVKNNLHATLDEKLMEMKFEESLWCQIKVEGEQLLIGLCYRTPTSSSGNDAELLLMLDHVISHAGSRHVMIIGDFNYPEIDYVNETVAAGETASATLFFNKTQELCLHQHVKRVTRERQGQVSSLLDYVFTEEENLIDEVNYETPLGCSDHVVLTWEVAVVTEERKNLQDKYSYFKGD